MFTQVQVSAELQDAPLVNSKHFVSQISLPAIPHDLKNKRKNKSTSGASQHKIPKIPSNPQHGSATNFQPQPSTSSRHQNIMARVKS